MADTLERIRKIDDTATGFISSKYNNISWDGSNLLQQISFYVKDKRIYLRESEIERVMETLLDTYQRQLRYRFDVC